MAVKVLLDTDIDILGDIDDALCLAYLLEQPACELLGITTVSWATDRRAMVASALCQAAGKDVPIYPGAAEPLLVELPRLDGPDMSAAEAAVLRRWAHRTSFARGRAVEFLRHTIHEHPGEVVLLAIGPMTNVGLLFAVDPEIPHLLKGLIMMCGVFADQHTGAATPQREWNARFDPHATALVYHADVAMHRSVGLDVTEQIKLDRAGFDRWFRPRRQPHILADIADTWFQHRPSITFHDPLAAATLFDPSICHWQGGLVTVEHGREELQGLTRWTPDAMQGRHEVALQVDVERFFQHYFAVFR
jgi:purine nucleosidase